MKWSKTELINQGNQELTINEAVTFDPESLASDRLRDLKNVTVTGSCLLYTSIFFVIFTVCFDIMIKSILEGGY